MGISIAFRYISGKQAYDMIPQMPQGVPKIKVGQYKLFLDDERHNAAAKELILLKHKSHNAVLKKIGAPTLNESLPESAVARQYFEHFGEYVRTRGYEYESRKGKFGVLNREATNIINSVLNLLYGYAEARLMREICLAGLDPQIGVLHKPTLSKESLSYDLIEMLRAQIDGIVLKLIDEHFVRFAQFQAIDSSHYVVKEPRKFIDKVDAELGRKEYRGCVEWLLKKLNVR